MDRESRKSHYNKAATVELVEKVTAANWRKSLMFRVDLFQMGFAGPKSILDLGSGGGELVAEYIASDHREPVEEVTCVDVSEGAVARGKYFRPEYDWVVADMAEYRPGRRFDLVVIAHCYYALERWERVDLLRRLAESAFNPGGFLMVSFGDVNFAAQGFSVASVVEEIRGVFDIVNVISSNEMMPVFYEVDGSLPHTLGRYFTNILARVRA